MGEQKSSSSQGILIDFCLFFKSDSRYYRDVIDHYMVHKIMVQEATAHLLFLKIE